MSASCDVRKSGFTLVEVLTVVAIIALLVGILVPSLAAAREITRRAVCQSNLYHCYVSCQTYAANWDGAIPPPVAGWYASTYTEDLYTPRPSKTATAASTSATLLGQPQVMVPQNLGTLYLAQPQIVSDPNMIYCPSQKYPTNTFDYYPQPFGKVTVAEYTNWFTSRGLAVPTYWQTSYFHNPHVKCDKSKLYSKPNVNTHPKKWARFEEFPVNKALNMDILDLPEQIAHSSGGTPGWNLVLGNGAAVYRPSQSVYDFMLGLPDGVGDVWGNFNVPRNMLEGDPPDATIP